MSRKQQFAKDVGQFLGVRERSAWFSGGSKVTADFQRDIGPLLGVLEYGPNKVTHMRAILESVAVPWNSLRHSSEDAENPGGNVTSEAYEDLLYALEAESAEEVPESRHRWDEADEIDEYVQRAIRRRRGQTAFRTALLNAYDGACAVSNSRAQSVLEAAHIIPFAAGGSMRPTNGILLRSDFHTLFDLRQISIDTRGWTLLVHESLIDTEYWELRSTEVAVPRDRSVRPDRHAIDLHRSLSGL